MFKKISGKECFEKRHSITYIDKLEYCKDKAFFQMAYEPNLEDPKTLNEKIIWLALNYKNPDIKTASDKILAKEWVSSKVGSQYVVPLVGVYDKVEDINLDALPEKFVIKSNCGWAAKTVKVVTDKSSLDLHELEEWLKPWNNYYYNNMCVGEEDIKPRLLVESLLGDGIKMISDYKLFVMNGKAQFFYIVDDRNSESQTKTYLDLDWNIMPCHRYDVPPATHLDKPDCIDEMIQIGETLSRDFPLVRVDFYYVNGQLYVGEMTFTPGMFLSIEPKEWDFKLGESLTLPKE